MTQISRDDVQHLAQLSSLQLDETQTDALQQDIEHILEYVEQLSELNTDGVEPTYQVTGLSNVWRNDTVIGSDVSREVLLGLPQEQADQQIKVLRVL